MDNAAFERLMRYWGRVYGWPKPDEWDEDESAVLDGRPHPLVAAQRVDGRSELKMDNELAKLRTRLRRRKQATARKENTHGDWRELAAEHRCYGAESRGGAKPMKAHPDADWVDRVALMLWSTNPVQGVILRIEYCTRGRHREKLPRAGAILDNPHLKLRYYRDQLEKAKTWMHGALSAGGALKNSQSVT